MLLHILVDDEKKFADEGRVFVCQTWLVSLDVESIEIDKFFIDTDGELVLSLNGVGTMFSDKVVSASCEIRALSESLSSTIRCGTWDISRYRQVRMWMSTASLWCSVPPRKSAIG